MCYETKSIIITTNLKFGQWEHVLGDSILTEVVIDRLIHHSHLIEGLVSGALLTIIWYIFYLINTTTGELVQLLKTEEYARKSQVQLKQLRESELVIIDDLMYMAKD